MRCPQCLGFGASAVSKETGNTVFYCNCDEPVETAIESLLDQANTRLLQASLSLIEQRREIGALKKVLAQQEALITSLQAQMRRSTLPFKRDLTVPALLRPQAG